MLSLDLRQILPPKMSFFVCKKVQISSKILPQIPKFVNFVKNQSFRHGGQFSSFRQFFIKKEILWRLSMGQNGKTSKVASWDGQNGN